MNVNILKQTITITDIPTIIRGTVGIKATFTFADDWADFEKTLVFKNSKTAIVVMASADGEYTIPHEMFCESGVFKIGFYGTKNADVYPTFWSDEISVEYGSDTAGKAPTPPTPSVYAEIRRIAQSVRDDADAGMFDGRGISTISLLEKVGRKATYTITYTDGTTSTFDVYDGEQGEKGVSVVSVATMEQTDEYVELALVLSDGTLTNTFRINQGQDGRGISAISLLGKDGRKATYVIYYTDGTISSFDVYDGEKGEQGEQGEQGIPGRVQGILMPNGAELAVDESGKVTLPLASAEQTGVVDSSLMRTVENLVNASKGIVYTEEIDETSAYIKNIASGTQRYGLLNAISGKTILWAQSANPATFVARTASGVTTTLSADGKSIIANGTANTAGAIALTVNVTNFMTNHKYMFEFVNAKPEIQYYTLGWTYYLPKGSHNVIQSSSVASIGGKPLYMAFDAGTVFDNFIITPQIFDLTQMFGAGNEPTTVEEFKAMFPNDYYEYDSGSLLSGKCDKVVSRKTDTTVISEYIIPEEVQNLEGYGQSYDNTYNVVDFDTKKFIAYGRYIDDVWTPYETPQITDISNLLTEDNTIEVEAGGTLEFHQQNETKLKIPSKQTYMIKVGDAL